MRLIFFLFNLRYANPIILTVLGMVAVVVFAVLDQGLSGGSAEDPRYAMAFLTAGGLGIVLLSTNGFGRAGRIIGILFGLSPFLFVASILLVSISSRSLALNKAQQNAKCAVEAAGIPEQDLEFVKMRLRQMRKFPSVVIDVESRLGITILPGCQFERRAPVSTLQQKPRPEEPAIQFEEYQPEN